MDVIGTKEVAEMLDYSTAYIRELLCNNSGLKEELNARKIGNTWIFNKRTVKKYINRRKRGASSIKGERGGQAV